MTLEWNYIHKGYYMATSSFTGCEYVVRTRPKGDGWMAIADTEGAVLAVGQSLRNAQVICAGHDAHLHGVQTNNTEGDISWHFTS